MLWTIVQLNIVLSKLVVFEMYTDVVYFFPN